MVVNNKLVLIFAFVELAIGILFKVLFKTFTKIESDKPNFEQEGIIPPTNPEEVIPPTNPEDNNFYE